MSRSFNVHARAKVTACHANLFARPCLLPAASPFESTGACRDAGGTHCLEKLEDHVTSRRQHLLGQTNPGTDGGGHAHWRQEDLAATASAATRHCSCGLGSCWWIITALCFLEERQGAGTRGVEVVRVWRGTMSVGWLTAACGELGPAPCGQIWRCGETVYPGTGLISQ